ncbi:MAG TPA: nucleotidyltransferase [Actinomycetota bacterium]
MTGLKAALGRTVEVLRSEHIPYMVIGGIANLVWGEARTTTDLDLTVDVDSIGVERFLPVARRCGSPIPDDPLETAQRGRLVPVRTTEGIRIDFALAALPFESEAIGRAKTVQALDVEFKVCTAEDLIIMKSVAPRPRDRTDVVGVLRRQGRTLDLARLDEILEGLAEDIGRPEIAELWLAAKQAAGLAPG